MTTTLSKIMTVFVTITCVGVMAGILANVMAGGPNWKAKAALIPEAVFDRANPEAPWTAKRKGGTEDLGGGPILPQAIVSVQKKLIQQEDDAQTKLDQDITFYKAKITEAKALIVADQDAIVRRQAQLKQQYDELQAKLDKLGQDFVTEATKQKSELVDTKMRREEYLAFKSQLDELRVQRQTAANELARLRDLLYQAQANLERANTRKKTLKAEGATVPEPAAGTNSLVEEPPPAAKPADPAPAEQPDAAAPETEKTDADKTEPGKTNSDKTNSDKTEEDKAEEDKAGEAKSETDAAESGKSDAE